MKQFIIFFCTMARGSTRSSFESVGLRRWDLHPLFAPGLGDRKTWAWVPLNFSLGFGGLRRLSWTAALWSPARAWEVGVVIKSTMGQSLTRAWEVRGMMESIMGQSPTQALEGGGATRSVMARSFSQTWGGAEAIRSTMEMGQVDYSDLEDFQGVGGRGLPSLKQMLRLVSEFIGLFCLDVCLGSCSDLLMSLSILATKIIGGSTT